MRRISLWGTSPRTALATLDRELLGAVGEGDCVWMLPGEKKISGDVIGVEDNLGLSMIRGFGAFA